MRLRASLAVLDSRLTDIGGFLPEDKHGLGHRHIVQVDDAAERSRKLAAKPRASKIVRATRPRI